MKNERIIIHTISNIFPKIFFHVNCYCFKNYYTSINKRKYPQSIFWYIIISLYLSCSVCRKSSVTPKNLISWHKFNTFLKSALNFQLIGIWFKGIWKNRIFDSTRTKTLPGMRENGGKSWLKLFFIFLVSNECIFTKITFSSKFPVGLDFCTPLFI